MIVIFQCGMVSRINANGSWLGKLGKTVGWLLKSHSFIGNSFLALLCFGNTLIFRGPTLNRRALASNTSFTTSLYNYPNHQSLCDINKKFNILEKHINFLFPLKLLKMEI